MFDKTTMMIDVRRILNSGIKNVFFKWKCEIIAGSERIIPFRVISAPLIRDYEKNIADKVDLRVIVREFEYDYITEAREDELFVFLYKVPQISTSENTNMYLPPSAQRFKAVINYRETPRPKMKTGRKLSKPTDGQLREQFKELRIEAFDLVAEKIRLNEVGLVGRNVNPLIFVRTILGKESKKISGGDINIRGVDIVEPSNTEIRAHIPTKDGAPLQDLPSYIQQTCGIYNAGIGFYLQTGLWYIYPLYDVTRYNKSRRTLTIFNISGNRFPGAESTFEYRDGILQIVNTGNMTFLDESEYRHLNFGNGVRFTHANAVTEEFGEYRAGKYFIKRKDNNTEAIVEERRDGENYAPVSPDRFTSNPYTEKSTLAQRQCSYVAFEWQNAIDNAVYPGMPTRVYFIGEGEIVKAVDGTVLGIDYNYETTSEKLTDPKYVCNAVIKLAIQRIRE